jgi:ribosomal protein S8
MFIYKKIKNKKRFLIRISPLYFKHKSFYTHSKLVTTPSREYSLNIAAMKTLRSYSGQTVFILSTSKGIMTMQKAFELNTGGIILYYLI